MRQSILWALVPVSALIHCGSGPNAEHLDGKSAGQTSEALITPIRLHWEGKVPTDGGEVQLPQTDVRVSVADLAGFSDLSVENLDGTNLTYSGTTIGGCVGRAPTVLSIPQHLLGSGGQRDVDLAPCWPPASALVSLDYEPVAPAGAVGFFDGYLLRGDGYNFFPNMVRLSASSVTHSDILDTSGNVGATLALTLRYAQPHATSGIAMVSLNREDNGAILVAANVEFDPTPQTADYSQWQTVKALTFTPTTHWPSEVYVRVQFKSGAIIYLDSAWIGRAD